MIRTEVVHGEDQPCFVHWLPCRIHYTGSYTNTLNHESNYVENIAPHIHDWFIVKGNPDTETRQKYPFETSFRGQHWLGTRFLFTASSMATLFLFTVNQKNVQVPVLQDDTENSQDDDQHSSSNKQRATFVLGKTLNKVASNTELVTWEWDPDKDTPNPKLSILENAVTWINICEALLDD